MTKIHLELMSKPVLIQHIRKAEAAAQHWRTRYELKRYAEQVSAAGWYQPTPEKTLEDATRLLGLIGYDPDAGRHREELEAALDEAQGRKPANGRCPSSGCGKPLDWKGRCTRHDWRARRAEREAS